jgi:hypothetical protein
VPLPPTAKIEGTPPTSAVPLKQDLAYRSRFAAATFEGNAWVTPEGGIFGEGDEHGAALDPTLDPDDEDQAGMEARRARAIRDALNKGWVRANTGREFLNIETAKPLTEQQRAVFATVGKGKEIYYDFRGHPEAFGLVYGRGPASFGQFLRDHDAFFKLNKTASDPDQYWVELVDDQKDKAKAEFLSHPDIKQIAQDNGWTMEEAWENVGRDFANEFHNPANRFFASAHAKSTWWDEPSENPFAKGMTKGQRIMEWLDGNRVSQEAGKYVFWHATPVQGGAGDIIRKGSYLATDPETAWHQASRDHGPKSGGIKIAKVLLAPEEVVPAGVWTKLGVDYPVAKWDITRPAAKFN